MGALDHARTCRRARRRHRVSGLPHFSRAGRVGEPLFHSLRARGRTRRRRSGLSGPAERADAMVAEHHAPARQFRARRRPHRSFGRHRPGRHRRPLAPRRRAVLGCRHGCRRTCASRQDHRRARPAHRSRADLDQDPREGHAKERRLVCRPAADRGDGRGRGPRRSPSSAQDASPPTITLSSTTCRSTSSPSACRSNCCRADDGRRVAMCASYERSETPSIPTCDGLLRSLACEAASGAAKHRHPEERPPAISPAPRSAALRSYPVRIDRQAPV